MSNTSTSTAPLGTRLRVRPAEPRRLSAEERERLVSAVESAYAKGYSELRLLLMGSGLRACNVNVGKPEQL